MIIVIMYSVCTVLYIEPRGGVHIAHLQIQVDLLGYPAKYEPVPTDFINPNTVE